MVIRNYILANKTNLPVLQECGFCGASQHPHRWKAYLVEYNCANSTCLRLLSFSSVLKHNKTLVFGTGCVHIESYGNSERGPIWLPFVYILCVITIRRVTVPIPPLYSSLSYCTKFTFLFWPCEKMSYHRYERSEWVFLIFTDLRDPLIYRYNLNFPPRNQLLNITFRGSACIIVNG